MSDSSTPPVLKLPRAEIPAIPARWGFFKGLLTGAAIEIPVLATTVWLLSRFGVGDPDAGFMRIMRLTTVFAGVAALLTAGGIGRLAAYASASGGRRRAVFVSARAHAIASALLVMIATIPHGHLPLSPGGWLPMPLAGLAAGIVCGAVIGAVCGGTAPVGFADVWSLARKPSDALRQLLSPDDIIKLGAALGKRTSTLFEGIFDPAPPPPKASESPPPDAKAPPAPASTAPSPAPAKDE
ncbi:MAG: hypothetical protein H0T42_02805 [Deltaproteobacteria bacterium]|nr:hypothetical protein [Deltaproteobacteria bacterium]